MANLRDAIEAFLICLISLIAFYCFCLVVRFLL